MEDDSKTIIPSEGCHKDGKTKIKEEQVSLNTAATASQKHDLPQNETYSNSYICSGDVGTKIGIKQERWDSNLVSTDTKYDPEKPSPLHPVQFIDTGTMLHGDEMQFKEEHFDQEEISTESQKHFLKSELLFVECDKSSELDTKQEIGYPNAISSDFNAEDPLTCQSTMTIKSDDEKVIKEEMWWCNRMSVDSQGEKKETKERTIEKSKEIFPLEPSRLTTEAICHDGNPVTYSDKKDTASHETLYRMNAKQSTPDPMCNSDHVETEQIMVDEITQLYNCGLCEKCHEHTTNIKSSLGHAGQKRYKCDICEKQFTTKSYLKVHSLVHLGMKRYKCDKCEKGYTQKSDLQRHKLLHSSPKPYKCVTCETCFTDMPSLRRHMLVHSSIKPYKCDRCETCFTRKASLQRHTLLHSGSKPYKCDICEKCFTNMSTLKRHIYTHSATTPYKCDICERCFTNKSHLERHKLFHSGVKPHTCDWCEKCFTQKSDLQRHILLHLDP